MSLRSSRPLRGSSAFTGGAATGSVDRRQTDLLRFACIFAMTFDHVAFGLDTLGHPVAYDVQVGLSRISAPLLGFLSGYFTLVALRRHGPTGSVRRRAVTLLRPYAFWNLVAVALATAAVAVGAAAPPDLLSVNSLLGVTAWPFNFPLHYLKDLFVCCVVAAGLYAVFGGRPVLLVGAAVLAAAAVVATATDYYNALSFWPRVDLALFFVTGLIASAFPALGGWLLGATRRWRLALLVAAGAAFLAMTLGGTIDDAASLPQRLAGALAVFALVLGVRRVPGWVTSRLALRLFCTHVITFMALNAGLGLERSPSLLTWVMQPFIALALAQASLIAEDALRAASGRILTQRALRP